ncbi:DUF6640 family protein [Sorangium sp. So ce726]|uniref:DUF6640 family protein n=1 Tax=Sorangium sp. So ce726 TaxID=3133319 RepID=UPI003F64693C
MSQRASKVLISIAAAATSIIPTIADVNHTHLFNPLWPPHARFHGAVLLLVNIISGVMALVLLWGRYEGRDSRLAVRFAAFLPAHCWGPFMPASRLPGTSSWPDGMEPFASIHPNMVLAVVIVAMSVGGVVLDRRARNAKSAADAAQLAPTHT